MPRRGLRRSRPPRMAASRKRPRPSSRASTRRSPRSISCSKRRAEMGQVVVTVNGRAFPLGCDDGQEARTRRLASYVDGKVGEFVKAHGQIGEARLILLAALVITDELSDTNDIVQRGGRGAGSSPGPDGSAAMASGIRTIAERIEAIAARLESS